MAKFKCNNCGAVFYKDVRLKSDLALVRCPSCSSYWVDHLGPGLPLGQGRAEEAKAK